MKEVRWRRFGHDRTYFKADDGTDLGWVDNITGEQHLQSDAATEIAALLAREVRTSDGLSVPEVVDAEMHAAVMTQGVTAVVQDAVSALDSVEPLPESAVPVTEESSTAPDWEDLALRRPGQAVREQAQAELAADWQQSKFRTALRIAFDSKTDERAWRMGAAGEVAIGSRLEKLADHGWRVLHSVPVGENGSDIDHLAIGPGGVWAINTKNHPGKKIWVAPRQIRVDGHTVPYIRNSEFEANRVRKILTSRLNWEPYVRSALVFMTGTLVPDVTIKGKPEHVDILDRMDVARRLKREPVRLTTAQVDEVFEIARRSTTWTR